MRLASTRSARICGSMAAFSSASVGCIDHLPVSKDREESPIRAYGRRPLPYPLTRAPLRGSLRRAQAARLHAKKRPMRSYLDFEKPVAEIEAQLEEVRAAEHPEARS